MSTGNAESNSAAASSENLSARAYVRELIVRQALDGQPWRQTSAMALKLHKINQDEIEDEVLARKKNPQYEPAPMESFARETVEESQDLEALLKSMAAAGDSVADAAESGIDNQITAAIYDSKDEREKKLRSLFVLEDDATHAIGKFRTSIIAGKACDRKQVSAAVANIYKSLGLKAPLLFFAEDPQQLSIFPWLLQAYFLEKNNKKTGLYKTVLKKLLADSMPGLRHPFENFEKQLSEVDFTYDSLGQNLNSRILHTLESLRKELDLKFELRFGENRQGFIFREAQRALGRLLSRVKDWCELVPRRLKRNLDYSVYSLMYEALAFKEVLTESEVADIKTCLSSAMNAGWNSSEMYWLLIHYCFLNFESGGGSSVSPEIESRLKDWNVLLHEGLAFVFFENAAFVLAYPEKIHLDESGRLHNDAGAAFSFGGGHDLYAYKGTVVPAWMFLCKEFLRPWIIDTMPNAEIRRILIEVYGWEKYLRSFGSKLIHEDKFGRLYKREADGLFKARLRKIAFYLSRPQIHLHISRLPEEKREDALEIFEALEDRLQLRLRGDVNESAEAIVAVEVLNSTPEPDGSFKRYLLRVPPAMQRARQAVAWTFGMTESEYLPELES